MKVLSFLALSFLIFSCDKLPLVTIFQLDVKHQVANPKKVIKWDTEKCVAVIEDLPAISMQDMALHGSFCLTPEDAGKWKAYMQAECRDANENKGSQK